MSSFLKEPEVTVRNLTKGEEYEFRVMAENQYGVSEPLETAEAIMARYPFGKYGDNFMIRLWRGIIMKSVFMYEFRVMAENQYGVSEPFETAEAIKARCPFGKYCYNDIIRL